MISRMESIIDQFKKDKESSIIEIRQLQSEMREAINKIKVIYVLKILEIIFIVLFSPKIMEFCAISKRERRCALYPFLDFGSFPPLRWCTKDQLR